MWSPVLWLDPVPVSRSLEKCAFEEVLSSFANANHLGWSVLPVTTSLSFCRETEIKSIDGCLLTWDISSVFWLHSHLFVKRAVLCYLRVNSWRRAPIDKTTIIVSLFNFCFCLFGHNNKLSFSVGMIQKTSSNVIFHLVTLWRQWLGWKDFPVSRACQGIR